MNIIMKTKKTCTQCKIEQPTTEFNKRTAAKDGLQQRCKTCCKSNSKYFRDVLRPDYYWGEEQGYFIKNREKTDMYNKDYFSANKTAKIYRIDLPEGSYIGATKRHLHTRLTQHVTDFKKIIREGKGAAYLPLLHNALANYELSDIKKILRSGYIIDQFNGNSTEMKQREKEWIIKLSTDGVKLLNILCNPFEKNTK
jgi:hypothetical protein